MKCAMVNMMKPDVPANDLPFLPPDVDIEIWKEAIYINRPLMELLNKAE